MRQPLHRFVILPNRPRGTGLAIPLRVVAVYLITGGQLFVDAVRGPVLLDTESESTAITSATPEASDLADGFVAHGQQTILSNSSAPSVGSKRCSRGGKALHSWGMVVS